MNTLSTNSNTNLSQCADLIQIIVRKVLKRVDIGVTCGHRGEKEQNLQYAEGDSFLKFPDSKHNSVPSKAVDLVIYHPEFKYLWGNSDAITAIAHSKSIAISTVWRWYYMQYARLDTLMQLEAEHLGIKLVWGGKWQHTDDLLDNKLEDLFHWEIADADI